MSTLNFANIKNVSLTEGVVKKIAVGGQTLWKAYDAEVEYLASSVNVNPYIDLGITPLVTDVHHVDFQYLDIDTEYLSVYGCANTTERTNCALYLTSGYICAVVGGSNPVIPADLSRHYYTLDLPNMTATIDSTTVSIVSRNIPNMNMSLNGRIQNGSIVRRSKLRIYSFEVVGRINLIPVRVGTVGYFYDKISGRLYGNAGTGSFTLGPDVRVL